MFIYPLTTGTAFPRSWTPTAKVQLVCGPRSRADAISCFFQCHPDFCRRYQLDMSFRKRIHGWWAGWKGSSSHSQWEFQNHKIKGIVPYKARLWGHPLAEPLHRPCILGTSNLVTWNDNWRYSLSGLYRSRNIDWIDVLWLDSTRRLRGGQQWTGPLWCFWLDSFKTVTSPVIQRTELKGYRMQAVQ